MKPRSLILTLTLGLVACLFACQDGTVMAPDDLQPEFGKPVKTKPSETPPAGIDLTGVLVGAAPDGFNWSYKKGVLSANGSVEVTTNFDAINDCYVRPGDEYDEGAEALEGLLRDGLVVGQTAVLRVDVPSASTNDDPGQPSAINRITSYVGEEAVRYFWIGPWGDFDDRDPETNDATVSDFGEDGLTISYTISGGVIGVRDNQSPKRAVKIACTYTGDVDVIITKNEG